MKFCISVLPLEQSLQGKIPWCHSLKWLQVTLESMVPHKFSRSLNIIWSLIPLTFVGCLSKIAEDGTGSWTFRADHLSTPQDVFPNLILSHSIGVDKYHPAGSMDEQKRMDWLSLGIPPETRIRLNYYNWTRITQAYQLSEKPLWRHCWSASPPLNC